MGRLFWKFFFFIWLVQTVGMIGVGVSFWLRDRAHAEHQHHARPPGPPPPPRAFEDFPPLAPQQHRGPQHPPNGTPLLPPIEVIIANLMGGLLGAGLLAWYFSKPICNLRSAFDAAADGKLDARLGPSMGKRRDELADLGHDFDRMAERLQKLVEGQRHLLHDVSHELRSPLARLHAAIGLVRQRPEKLEATIDRIELESDRMDHLVGELLTLSRLETGMAGDMSEEFNLGDLIAEIIEDARFEAELQHKFITLEGECNVMVRGRAELLGRAIENVVRNAIRHTPENTAVWLDCTFDESGSQVKLSIRDHGAGVPENDLQRIFDPFFRSEAGNTNDGHGLGLAIARRVTQAHGGEIVARNGLTGGLCVEISLPAQPSHPA